MRGSGRGRLAALAMFLLIALVVIGNLIWATASTLALARKRVTEDHERRVAAAVAELNSYMAGILMSESARDHRDYTRNHLREVLEAYTAPGAEVNVAYVRLLSPLAERDPPHDWIDVYFEFGRSADNTDFELSSPQVPEEEGVVWHGTSSAVPARITQTWNWLKEQLSDPALRDRVADACAGEHAFTYDSTEADPDSQQVRAMQRLQVDQQGYLPPSLCVDASIAERYSQSLHTLGGAVGNAARWFSGDIEIKPDPIATPFWLGVGPNGSGKLAFVRECHWGDGLYYQGFVGDWSMLRPKLLAVISGQFPQPTLIPRLDDTPPDPNTFSAEMMNLPVRLSMAGPEGGVAMAAWRSVRGTVIATWLAAAAVLAVAGWGLRNLVKLTERRMQFAYSVTHELRTPLTTFRLYADMLSAGLVPEDSRGEYLDTLNTESQRLSKLVEDVLEYARLENQRVRLNTVETDAATLHQTVSETLERRCAETGVAARTERALANGAPIRTDLDVVNRIAGVLVNNACRHARAAKQPTVMMKLGAEDGKIVMDVIDSGPGIDRLDARAIFKPFRRGRRAEHSAQRGIGLGLALASSWAELLGGRLTLAARHDPTLGGAHFRLTFPTDQRA